MSKSLYLMRHAKSSWDDATISDRDRGLNNRGRRNAPRMGRALADHMQPMMIRVSPARRAQSTLGGLQDGWPALGDFQHRTEEALYTFSAADLVHYIQQRQQSDETSLFLLGHNPAMTDLVNWICGESVLANLPTAGFVHLELPIKDWAELDAGCGRLYTRILPREL